MNCAHKRTVGVTAKCSDCCHVDIGGGEVNGYVPDDMGIGGGDYVEFAWCLDCGRIIGDWPCPQTDLEKQVAETPDDEDSEVAR